MKSRDGAACDIGETFCCFLRPTLVPIRTLEKLKDSRCVSKVRAEKDAGKRPCRHQSARSPSISVTSDCRARLTRLLNVPIEHRQISAASL
jgi:hypothetical protein